MNRFNAIDERMNRAVGEGVFPGGVVMAGGAGGVDIAAAAGMTRIYEGGRKVTPDTVFDLASLTKPLATALAVMRLAAGGKIALTDPACEGLKGECPSEKAAITWENLLCHNSGLPDYRPYYEKLLAMPEQGRKSALHRMIMAEPLLYAPGRCTLYSDIGFLLLQLCIEAVTGKPFPCFVQNEIYPSLSVSGLFFPSDNERGTDSSGYAATEVCPFRGLLQGVVHDENAFAVGGAAGHAGLFGTAGAVYQLLAKLLDAYAGGHGGGWLSPERVRRFLTVPENAQRTPGFDVPSKVGSSCGRYFSKARTVGHLGFTGTSFWMDLDRKIIVILLTNRVHPSRSNEKIKQFRPVIHDEIMQRLL